MILYYDDEHFKYDITNAIGDFFGDIVVDACDIIDDYTARKTPKGENKHILESVLFAYLCKKEHNGLKDWICQFYKENEMIKIRLMSLFDKTEANINLKSMKVSI
jgi:hypothetical protein